MTDGSAANGGSGPEASGPHEEGLRQRPGGPVVPGLRGLRDPVDGPGLPARARRPAAQDGVRERASAARGGSCTTWTPTGSTGSTAGRRPSPRASPRRGPDLHVWVDHGRRRRAVDRRKPPDPRAAPQREPEDPDVQQPDLRADQGPVLADQRGGQGHEVDAVRLARPPVQPGGARARARRRRSWRGRSTSDRHHFTERAPGGRAARWRGVHRDLPELQRLQRRRLHLAHRQGDQGAEPDPAGARAAGDVRGRRRAVRRGRVRWHASDR